MAQPDELFNLIHSLDKSEKRYFKLFVKLGTGRAHVHSIILFDLMEALEKYDEVPFKKSLKDKALLNNLASSKSRLQDLILKSLRLMNSEVSLDSELSAYLLDLEILFEKQLVKLARKRIRKAKALALHFEKEAHLLNLIHWEQRFFVLDPDEEEAAFYARNEEEEKNCIERLALQRNLFRLYEQLRSLIRKGIRPRDPTGKAMYKAIISHPALKKYPSKDFFLAQALYLAIKGNYAFAVRNHHDSWKAFRDLMDLWHSREDRIPDLADFYLGSFSNYANASLRYQLNNHDFSHTLTRIKALSGLPPVVRLKFERVTYTHELNLKTNYGSYSESVAFLKELEEWLNKNKNRLQDARLLLFYFNITLFCFSSSEFSKSQKWLNNILNFPATEARADIRDFARIFQLVLQYELGNLDVQEYLLRSAYRYFNRTQKLHDYEDALLTFMKGEQKTAGTNRKATKDAFEKLHTALLSIRSASDEAEPIGMQVLLFWIESHLKGEPLKEYYARKVKEREAEGK